MSNKLGFPLALPTVGVPPECPPNSVGYYKRIFVNALRLLISIVVFASLPAHASSVGWLMISAPGDIPSYYYDPLNIKIVKPGFNSVIYTINYTNDEGELESLVGSSIYDCNSLTKQEQYIFQYKQHWAAGNIIYKGGLEEEWGDVKEESSGMKLLTIVCR